MEAGATENEWKHFLAYVGAFYSNMANYHSFGHMKFVPDPSNIHAMKTILQSNPLYKDEDSCYKEVIDSLYNEIETEIFEINKPYTDINFPEQGGITGYFSRNMKQTDLALIKEFLASQSIDILNTRAFKYENGTIVITVGSISKDGSKQGIKFKGALFDIQYGEFSAYLKECTGYLKDALKYTANETQSKMLEHYISHYQTGNIETHKDSQREWVKDKGPVVESN